MSEENTGDASLVKQMLERTRLIIKKGISNPEEPIYPGKVTFADNTEVQVVREMNMTDWQKFIHEWAERKGWNQDLEERSFGDWCQLLATEISEMYEEHRNHMEPTEIYWTDGSENGRKYTAKDVEEILAIQRRDGEPLTNFKPCGIPIEAADLAIRLLHFFEYFQLNAHMLVAMKMAYNETRPYRHGGKKV